MGFLSQNTCEWFVWVGLCLVTLSPVARAQVVRSAEDLKGLGLDQLLQTRIISVSRTLEDWQGAPTAISVLTAPEIERTGAVRLADALRYVPGLSVSRYLGSSYSITARGFGTASVNKMEVLLDGRSLYTPLFSGVFWEVQDVMLDDLDRIEVVRGPGATLWGANAVNGVINLVSKDARDTQGTLLSLGGGDEERAFAAWRYGGQVGDDAWYRVYVKHLTRDEQVFADGTPAGDGTDQTQAGFRFDAGARGADHLTLQGDIYWNRFGTFGRPDAENHGWNVLGRWTRRFSDRSELQVQSYYDHAFRDVPLQFRESRDTFDLETQWHVQPLEHHEFVFGLDGRVSADRTGTEPDRTFRFLPAQRTLRLYSGFVQDQITLVPNRWTLFAGSKMEHNDYSGIAIQPSLRLAFTPDHRQTLWAAVSRAVRTPTRVDTDSEFLPNPASGVIVIQGNPDFAAESLLAWELGYRVQPHHALYFDVATFYNHYDDLRSLEPTLPGGLPLVLDNLRMAVTYGAEFVATVQPTRSWRLRASVNYLHEDLDVKPGSLDSTGGSLEADDPSWTATLQSTLNLPGGFEFDVFAHGATARPLSGLAGYTTADVRLAWRSREDWEVELAGRNLLGPAHAEFPASGRQPEVERAIDGRVTFHF